MASFFYRDDNGTPLHDPEGMRPVFLAVRANTGAGIAELGISTINAAANRNQNGDVMLRVSVQGANPCYFSLGAAGAAPGANTSMITLMANSVQYMRARSTDVSAYHQQITGASAVEVSAVV